MNLSSFFLLFWQNKKEINCASVSTEKKKGKKKKKKRENILVRVREKRWRLHTRLMYFILKLLLHSVASPFSPLKRMQPRSGKRRLILQRKENETATNAWTCSTHTHTLQREARLNRSTLIHMHQDAVKAVMTICGNSWRGVSTRFFPLESFSKDNMTYLPAGWFFFFFFCTFKQEMKAK